jgi:DNA-binding SARP family transcriptional activator
MGSFELRVDGELIVLPLSAQRLIALVALERRPMGRSRTAGLLWPDKTEARASANLRSTLWRMNNCISGVIESDNGAVSLTDGVALDIDFLQPCELNKPRALSIIDSARFAAELLSDWYDEWVIIERERIRQRTLRTLENASAELRRLGLFPAAIEAGSAAIKLAPLRESAHRAVIEAHLVEGNYSEAVRQYEAFTSIIFDALGVLPSPALGQLFDRSREQHLVAKI